MITLASASPQRRQLLAQLGVAYQALAVDIDERCLPSETPRACAKRLALEKARTGLTQAPQSLVIGSDTMVVVEGEILGKPADRAHALQMLERLSGKQHEVLTAVALVNTERELSCVQCSNVVFRQLERAEIEVYWQTGEPRDKAGGYAIQGLAAQFIKRLDGSFSGVMGLPLYETADLLKAFGVSPLESFNV